MTLIKFSQLAAHNNRPFEPRNYRINQQPPAAFKAGDVAPCVVYNALRGTEGTACRMLAQKTSAHVFSSHVVLDTFDPLMNLTLAPDREPLFELLGYLVDQEGRERLLFVLETTRDR